MDDVSAVRRFDLLGLSPSERSNLLRNASAERTFDCDRLRRAMRAVRNGRDEALCELMLETMDVDLDPSELQIGDGDFVHAFERLDCARTREIEETVERLRDFHQAEMPQELWLKQVRPGHWAGHRFSPIDSVACFVPAGDGKRSERAVMNAIPALIADVPKVVLVTPPAEDGSVSDLILVAAATAGVGEIYKLDAVSAAIALAVGTERVPRVEKLLAPHCGSLASASAVLADDLEIAMIGRGSRAGLLADEWANADVVKAKLLDLSDMLDGASPLLISPSTDLLDAVAERWPGPLACDVVLAPSMAAAVDFVNQSDISHLCVFAVDPMSILPSVQIIGEVEAQASLAPPCRNAAGRKEPFHADDLCRSSLSVFDFLRRTEISYAAPPVLVKSAGPASKAATLDEGAFDLF